MSTVPPTLLLPASLVDPKWIGPDRLTELARGPGWAALARRARIRAEAGTPDGPPADPGHERWLQHRLSLPGGAPLAAWATLASRDTVDAPSVSSRLPRWRLDPVHLHVGRDHLVLTDPAALALDADDATALAAAIAPLFVDEGLVLRVDLPSRWLLEQVDPGRPLVLATRSMLGALGRSIDAWQPVGPDARRWRRLVNEVQMTWHVHPVNERRESEGRQPVNSLWIEGPCPHVGPPADPAASRRRDAAIRLAARPRDGGVLTVDDDRGPIVVDDRLLEAQVAGDPQRWAQAWRDLDATCFGLVARAQGAWRDGTCIVLAGDAGWREIGVAARDGWRFWRRADAAALLAEPDSPGPARDRSRRRARPMSAPMRLATRRVDPAALARLVAGGVSPLMARLYAGRGIAAIDTVGGGPADLIPPALLHGSAAAATLLADAIAQRQRLLIVGDYDCDGATGVAVGVLGLRMMGAVVDYLVPNRFDFGYGLTPEIVDAALVHPRMGRPDLLITVDNGVASLDGVARARAAGLKVLVTDHHLPGPTLPDADVLVNPNQLGCGFPSKHLAGVGVMFYVLLALRAELRTRGAWAGRAEPRLADLLDLVALGTVADVVRLDRNNRLLVAAGLRRLRAGHARPGLLALLRRAGREPRAAGSLDLGFALGPRINAAGRLSDISLGVECLLADDDARADELAARLDEMNRERRDIEAGMSEQAMAEVGEPDPSSRTLVAFRPDWHQGVIGLVASRLKERFTRPTIALARDDRQPGLLKGSGRSIAGLHLRDALDLADRRAPGLLIRFGGHAMAAGLTLAEDGLERFRDAFEGAVRELADPSVFSPVLETDGPLAPEDLHAATVAEIEHEVWGQGFPPPLFADRFHVLGQRLVKDRHLKLDLRLGTRRVSAIAFGRTEPIGPEAVLAYQLQRDDWQGADGISLIVKQVDTTGTSSP